jgi:hypothetical protein
MERGARVSAIRGVAKEKRVLARNAREASLWPTDTRTCQKDLQSSNVCMTVHVRGGMNTHVSAVNQGE